MASCLQFQFYCSFVEREVYSDVGLTKDFYYPQQTQVYVSLPHTRMHTHTHTQSFTRCLPNTMQTLSPSLCVSLNLQVRHSSTELTRNTQAGKMSLSVCITTPVKTLTAFISSACKVSCSDTASLIMSLHAL